MKQELPVIPKYVAEYLEFAKGDVPLMRILEIASTRDELPKWRKEYDWISMNDEDFARAWLDGYAVAEEPLYYALIKVHELMNSGNIYWIHDKSDDSMFISNLHTMSDYFTTTEMSKVEWNELGINDSNADFVKVNE